MNPFEAKLSDATRIRLTFLQEDVLRIQRVQSGPFADSGLNRYGFIISTPPLQGKVMVEESPAGYTAETSALRVTFAHDSGEVAIEDKRLNRLLLRQVVTNLDAGHAFAGFEAEEDEDWVGFGDQTRERLYHRGQIADLWVRNVSSYIPVPFFMSTRGVGILVNTTHHIVFDMCASEPNRFSWSDKRGIVDYYVFAANNFKQILGQYTTLTGKPKLPPLWSFGLWYLCRMQANDHEVVNNALQFRREKIPCDVIGLEPGWMQTNYDYSIEKDWHSDRFPIPSYARLGPYNFFNALYRMGYHLGLWLCNHYDLSYEAERQASGGGSGEDEAAAQAGSLYGSVEIDDHLESAEERFDHTTHREEAWFDHLKKFVDQGVSFFKQDAATQVLDHPDRLYGNGMTDDEMHNLYPLLYSKQMYIGYREYTGRRPLTFSPAGWAGCQAWCGTWSGDTGGRLDTLGGLLNLSLIGQSWTTNDMEVIEPEGIHFGYLLPWSQINSWNYFRMPWLQGERTVLLHRYYSSLRSRLIPYLYSWAYHASQAGQPLMIPLTLEFQEDLRCRRILHEYLLGRDLLVTIYDNRVYFPEGRWKDYWSGAIVEGPAEREIRWPEERGGGLFVREGGIIPHGPITQYAGQADPHELMVYLFPSEQKTTLELYEDDGVSLKHTEGQYSLTTITAQARGRHLVVQVEEPRGTFMPKVEDRTWSFTLAVEREPESIEANGKTLNTSLWDYDSHRQEIRISSLHAPLKLVVNDYYSAT